MGSHDQNQLFLPFDAPLQLLEPEELFQLDDAEKLRRVTEDCRVERKPATYTPRALGDYICMWANSAPSGGLIVIGMEDDGTISGCIDTDTAHLNKLEQSPGEFCPHARVDSRRLPCVNRRGEPDFLWLILVAFRPDRVVRTTKGNVFVRRGDSKRQLSDEEIRELEIDRRQRDFESEPSTLGYPDDYDEDAIRNFANAVRASRGLEPSHTVEQILQHRHLGKLQDGIFHPNHACTLLFARQPRAEFPGCRVRFLRFDGESEGSGERYNAVKDVWLEGPVPSLAREAESLVSNQLRDFSRLGADGKFYTAAEYPKEAWYEGIINALVHRSYGLRNMHVQIKMFDDRLEVVSPGGFPPLVTAENIYEVQHSRNPFLMDAMYYLDFVKMANEGTRRIRDRMQDAGLPMPEFDQMSTVHASVRVVLRNDIKQRKVWLDSDATDVVGVAVFSNLTQDQKRLVNWIAEHKRINVSQAQRLVTSRTWHTAKKLLLGLVELGILVYRHRDDIERDPKAHFALANESVKSISDTE